MTQQQSKQNKRDLLQTMIKYIDNNQLKLCTLCNKNLGKIFCNTDDLWDEIFLSNKCTGQKKVLCEECYKLDNNVDQDYLHDLVKCGNCELLFDGDLFYECLECGNNICSQACIRMTSCQTRSCVCVKCFIKKYAFGKCIQCQKKSHTNS